MNQSKIFKVIFLAYTSLFLLGLGDNIRGPLYPEILDAFRLSDTQGAFFFSISSTFGILGSYLSSKLHRKLGTLPTLRISFVIFTIGQIMISAAPSFFLLLTGVAIFGLGLGIMGVVQNTLIVQEIPAGPFKNKILSGLHSMYAAASLAAPMIVTMLAAQQLPISLWRMSFIAVAAISLFVFASSYWGPQLHETRLQAKHENPPSGETSAQIFFGVAVSTYVLTEILVSSRMALYMRREFASSLEISTWYTGAFFVALLASRVTFALWTPNLKVKTQVLISLVLSTVSLLAGIFLHPLGLVASGFFMGPFYPLMMGAAGHLFPKSVSQALSWIIGLSSFFIVVMHFLVGLLTDQFGLQRAFLLGPFFLIVSIVMLVFYEKIFRRLQHTF